MRGKDIRKGNEKLVLRLIQREGLLSQSEAVELTGLKAPTILRIFSNLEEAGLIVVSDKQKEVAERKGRKPVFYRLNAEALYIIGVEFWSLSATVVISNFVREPVYSANVDIDRNLNGEGVLEVIYRLIEDSLAELGIEEAQLGGIGIGAPGKVDIKTGTVLYYSRIKGLQDISIAEYFEKRIDVPILVHNNCSVLAMNEYTQSNSPESENIMSILIRGGVGGAYLNGGKVLTSHEVTTMEIGHLSVDLNGRPCSCGAKGCLETYLSEDAIIEDLSAAAGIPVITDFSMFDDIIRNAATDSRLIEILDEKAEILAFAIGNLMHLFSPDSFFLISRSIELCNYLSSRAVELLEQRVSSSVKKSIRIKPVCYDPLHAGMGACDIVFHDFFY